MLQNRIYLINAKHGRKKAKALKRIEGRSQADCLNAVAYMLGYGNWAELSTVSVSSQHQPSLLDEEVDIVEREAREGYQADRLSSLWNLPRWQAMFTVQAVRPSALRQPTTIYPEKIDGLTEVDIDALSLLTSGIISDRLSGCLRNEIYSHSVGNYYDDGYVEDIDSVEVDDAESGEDEAGKWLSVSGTFEAYLTYGYDSEGDSKGSPGSGRGTFTATIRPGEAELEFDVEVVSDYDQHENE
jgi:hypothetical protein